MKQELLSQHVLYTDREDDAAIWAMRLEFQMRRAWWRRVRFTPVINGMLAMTEAFRDLGRVVGATKPSTSQQGVKQ